MQKILMQEKETVKKGTMLIVHFCCRSGWHKHQPCCTLVINYFTFETYFIVGQTIDELI